MKLIKKKISDLNPAVYNPRNISDEAMKGLESSLEKFGYVEPIIWNERTGNVVGGHQRLKVLQKQGKKEVEVIVLDLSEIDEKALNVALNNKHIQGDWDYQKLEVLLGELKVEFPEYEDIKLDSLEIEIDENSEFEEKEIVEDETPEIQEKIICKKGDLWTLGKHRLLCGDSTSKADVEKLMDGKKADMVLTDPPYGVSYVGRTNDALVIENDALGESELTVFIGKVFDNMVAISRLGAYWYATVPARPLHLVFALDWKNRGILRQIMVWVKDSLVLGHSEYHYKHEPILFGWVPNGTRYKNPDRTRNTVWDCARPKKSVEHPTMKPVELWCRAIRDGSLANETIIDPFLGSGTTLIACEQLDRICYGVEISEQYCDMIIRRWQNLTKKEAIREDGKKFNELAQ